MFLMVLMVSSRYGLFIIITIQFHFHFCLIPKIKLTKTSKQIAGRGRKKSRWFEANSILGKYHPSNNASNPVAIPGVLSRINVLPSVKQHLPSLLLPFSSLKHLTIADRLHRDHSHDHHLIFPTNLLHFPMWTTLAFHLPWWRHSLGNFHNCNTTITSTVSRQIPGFSSLTLLFNGVLRVRPCDPCSNRQLEQPKTWHYLSLWVSHGSVLFDRDHVLCDKNSWKMEAWVVWSCWPQPSNISRVCCVWCFGSLQRHACVFGVAWPLWLCIDYTFLNFIDFECLLFSQGLNCYIAENINNS